VLAAAQNYSNNNNNNNHHSDAGGYKGRVENDANRGYVDDCDYISNNNTSHRNVYSSARPGTTRNGNRITDSSYTSGNNNSKSINNEIRAGPGGAVPIHILYALRGRRPVSRYSQRLKNNKAVGAKKALAEYVKFVVANPTYGLTTSTSSVLRSVNYGTVTAPSKDDNKDVGTTTGVVGGMYTIKNPNSNPTLNTHQNAYASTDEVEEEEDDEEEGPQTPTLRQLELELELLRAQEQVQEQERERARYEATRSSHR
jgi:hypothetical protein